MVRFDRTGNTVALIHGRLTYYLIGQGCIAYVISYYNNDMVSVALFKGKAFTGATVGRQTGRM